MNSVNRVWLSGRLTHDPELKQTSQGQKVCSLTVAVNETRRRADGAVNERVSFIEIVVWSRQAENCARYLRKGRSVLVEGRLQQERWETAEGPHSRLRVWADHVQFLTLEREMTDADRAPRAKPEAGAAHTGSDGAQRADRPPAGGQARTAVKGPSAPPAQTLNKA